MHFESKTHEYSCAACHETSALTWTERDFGGHGHNKGDQSLDTGRSPLVVLVPNATIPIGIAYLQNTPTEYVLSVYIAMLESPDVPSSSILSTGLSSELNSVYPHI